VPQRVESFSRLIANESRVAARDRSLGPVPQFYIRLIVANQADAPWSWYLV